MKLILEAQPLLVDVGVWVSTAVFLVGFVGVLCAIYLTLIKTEALVNKSDEAGLSYWERAARKNSRASNFLIQPRFRKLRYLLFASATCCLVSLGILIGISAVFGERVESHKSLKAEKWSK